MWGLLILFGIAAAIIVLLGTTALLRSITRPRRKTFAVALSKGDPTEPSEVGLAGDAVVWTLSGGVESPGWVLQGEQSDGPAVVIIHGHRNSRYGALHRASRLVAFASRVVVFDLPGHGDTLGGRCTLGVHEPADVAKVIEQLGDERVVLFGSSLGAGIAIGTAADYPAHIVGAIVEGPFRYWHEPVHRLMKLKHYPVQPFLALCGLWLRFTGVKLNYDRAQQASRIGVPMMVMHGSADPICPVESAREIAQAANGELVVFDDAMHQDLSLADEPRYQEAVTRFFDRMNPTAR